MNTTKAEQKSKVINAAEYNRIKSKFPSVDQASYQAGSGEYFVVEWTTGNAFPNRLVHYFRPIF